MSLGIITMIKPFFLAMKDRLYIWNPRQLCTEASQEKKGKTNVDFKTLNLIKKKHRSLTRFMETRDDDKYKEYWKYRNQVEDLTRKAIRNKGGK